MIDLFTAMRVELQLYAVPWNNCIVHTVRGRGPAEAEAWRRGGGLAPRRRRAWRRGRPLTAVRDADATAENSGMGSASGGPAPVKGAPTQRSLNGHAAHTVARPRR